MFASKKKEQCENDSCVSVNAYAPPKTYWESAIGFQNKKPQAKNFT